MTPGLADIDIGLEQAELALVAGTSGSGKSTLLRCVNGLVPHSSGGVLVGEVVVASRSTVRNKPRDLADLVGFVHQDPEAHFVVDRVEGDIAFSLENLGTEPDTMRRRVEEVLDALDIARLRHRSPASLSGGERQRCAIASALAVGPAVLVLDEPTSQLDPQGAEDVIGAVVRLNQDLGTTVLMAEHRLERVAAFADRALLMGGGRVVGDGDPTAVLADYPGAPPVTRLGRLLGWDPPPLTVKGALSHLRREPDAVPVPVDPAGPPPAPAAPGEAIVTAEGLDLRHGKVRVLSDVSFTAKEGEAIAVLGRNGSGKTTLLRTLAGLHRPQKGKVDCLRRASYVPQDPNTLLSAPTVRAELEQTQRLLGRVDHRAVDHWLDRLHLTHLAPRHPRSLSSGERQRVAIAAVAVGGAELLLLDEPTRGMDAESREALRSAITSHVASGGSVVLATHDVELAAGCATTVVVLGEGQIVAAGAGRTVLTGSLFAPQVLRVMPPFLTVDEVRAARTSA
ncbi:MAG: ATP-binding cassette domain-containing protein [Actinobacteria bacterium]|nr:MAG: ATP-binding cassette domain-containing protein [Actinomycetota bacterium]RIK05673.1 MAG: hypothetical protein DCC48_09570 [Acidobacteriota bacterium]